MSSSITGVLERPSVYRLWQGPFVESKLAPLRRNNDFSPGRPRPRCGLRTRHEARMFERLDYLGVDLSAAYVDHTRRKHAGGRWYSMSGASPCRRSRTYDFILVKSLFHHLDTPTVRATLDALSMRLSAEGHVHVFDLELPASERIPRRLALSDRGKYARPRRSGRPSSLRGVRACSLRAVPGSRSRAGVLEDGLLQGAPTVSTSTLRNPPTVSVAIALHNEQEVLPELLRRLTAVLDDLPGGPHEIVLVDDGSDDQTFALISDAASNDGRIVGLSLSRNFGHQAALSAALEATTGDVVVLMDGDLQDSPGRSRGSSRRSARGTTSCTRRASRGRREGSIRACYHAFYRILSKGSDLRMQLDSGDFALLSRRVVDRINSLPERHRYLRGLRTWVVLSANRHPGGSSGESCRDTELHRHEALPPRVRRDLRLLGCAATRGVAPRARRDCGGVRLRRVSIFIRVFLGESPQGFTALIVAVIFFSGVQLMFLGVIGEYLGRVYDETKARPQYIVASVVGGANASATDVQGAARTDSTGLTSSTAYRAGIESR